MTVTDNIFQQVSINIKIDTNLRSNVTNCFCFSAKSVPDA